MAIKIIEISPKTTPTPSDKVVAHLAIQNFKWINEQNLQTGVSSLAVMFDWIVNKKGVAYVRKDNDIIPVFGANTINGKSYLRCLKNGSWSDELLELPIITT